MYMGGATKQCPPISASLIILPALVVKGRVKDSAKWDYTAPLNEEQII